MNLFFTSCSYFAVWKKSNFTRVGLFLRLPFGTFNNCNIFNEIVLSDSRIKYVLSSFSFGSFCSFGVVLSRSFTKTGLYCMNWAMLFCWFESEEVALLKIYW